MGFADYLSRHPKNNPIPPSADDTQFIVNLINDFKFIHTQNSINYTSATRTNSDKYQTNQVHAYNNTHANNYEDAFCLNLSNFQPLSLHHSNSQNSNQFIQNKISLNSNLNTKPQGLSSKVTSINSLIPKTSKQIPQGYQTIHVTTRNRPKLNTFDQKITKRQRAPNKMNNNKTTIGTQTDENTNKQKIRKGGHKTRPPKSKLPLSQHRQYAAIQKKFKSSVRRRICRRSNPKGSTNGTYYKTNQR